MRVQPVLDEARGLLTSAWRWIRSLLVTGPVTLVTVALVGLVVAQALIVLPGRARYEWRQARQREPAGQPAPVVPLRRYFPEGTGFFERALALIPPGASYAVNGGDALRLAAPYVLLPRREVLVGDADWILSTAGVPSGLSDRIERSIALGDGVELLEVRR